MHGFGACLRRSLLPLALVAGLVAGSARAVTTTATYTLVGSNVIPGGSLNPWITKGSLPAGSMLKSVTINAKLQAQGPSAGSWISDLCVYFDPTPATVGDDGVLQVGTSTVFGNPTSSVAWVGGQTTTVGVTFTDTRSAPADFPAGIDLSTVGIYVGNCYADAYWSGTVSVTYEQVGPADIISFGVPGVTGVIGDSTVVMTVPFGTNVTNLAPTFTLASGATCDKVSGSSQNFTNPVLYTVTSADHSVTKVYTVTAVVQQGLLAKSYDNTYGASYLAPIETLMALTPSGTTTQVSNLDYSGTFYTSFPGLTANTTFSILWEGWFNVAKDGPGAYTFGTNSNEGSVVYMDLNNDGDFADPGELIVNNNGDHGSTSATGTVTLNGDLTLVHTVIGYYQVNNSPVMTAGFKKGSGLAYSALTPINGTSGYFASSLPLEGPSSANILTFSLGDNRAGIIGNNITLTVPYGTDVTYLAPTYTVSPLASEDLAYPSGSARNFSSPKTYTITAQDSTTKTYTVTVVVAAGSPAKDILTFGPGAVISGTNITWTVQYGTNVTALAPSYTVSPLATEDAAHPSDTPRNFSTPQTYTITAQDGSTKVYTVTVVIAAASSAKDITSFGPGAVIGTNTITWTVPYATDLTTLAPSYTVSAYALEDAAHPSDSVRNFTTPQTYTITAQDGTTKVYTVTVVRAGASSANFITFFTFPGLPAVTISGSTISVSVPYSTDVTALAPEYTVSAYALEDAAHPSGSVRNFTNPQTYTITAQNGATQVYTVTVTRNAPSNSKNMLTFGPGAVFNGTNVTWTLPFGTDVTNLAPTYTLSLYAIEDPLYPSGTTRNFTNPQVYTIHAENGSTQAYTVTVVIGIRSTAKDILTIGPGSAVNGYGAVTGTNVLLTVPVGTNLTNLTPLFTISPLATANPASGTTRDFTTPQTYTITAEDGSTKVYTVTIAFIDGLVAYLPLDGNYEEIVNDNDLTATGTPTFVTGKIGQGVKLTSSQRLRRQTTANLPTGDGEFSWATWLILDSTGSTRLFLNWGLYSPNQFCAGGANSAGNIIGFHNSTNSQTFSYQPAAPGSTWVHVALVYQNSGGVREQRLYVNGVLNSSRTLTGAALALTNSDFTLGGTASGAGLINAELDDVGIWSVMLPASKIAAIHGLGEFSGVPLNDPSIAQVLALSAVGQSVTNVGPNHHTWTYKTGLSGATGTFGGTVAGGNAYIVLNGAAGTGIGLASDPYGTWAAAKGLTSLNNAATADPDHDGLTNLAEFAFNGLPTNASSRGSFVTELKDNNADTFKELTFTCAVRRSSANFVTDANNAQTATIDGVTYTIEATTSLTGAWNNTVTYIGKSDTPPTGSGLPSLAGADWEYRTFSAFPRLGDKGFIRARVTKP